MTPDTVFKFVNVRPVQRAEPSARRFAVFKQSDTDLQRAIGALAGADQTKTIALADAYLKSDMYLKSNPFVGATIQVLQGFVAATTNETTAADAKKKAAVALGWPVDQWLVQDEPLRVRNTIWDAALAHYLSPNTRPDERDSAFTNARIIHAIEFLASLSDLAPSQSLSEIYSLSLVFPKALVPQSKPPKDNKSLSDRTLELKKAAKDTHERVTRLQNAARELRSGSRSVRMQGTRTLPIRIEGAVNELTPLQIKEAGAAASLLSSTEMPAKADRALMRETVIYPAARPWVFEAMAAKHLSEVTRQVLAPMQSALVERSASEIAHRLDREAQDSAVAFMKSIPPEEWGRAAEDEAFLAVANVAAIPFSPAFKKSSQPVPDTPEHRGLRPLGIGDLLVVKQKLLRYAAGEVAHIENVLKTEKKATVNSRLRETEETTITETEELEETEKDLQSTERFELHKEAEKSAESSMAFDAGVAVTASYGPVSLSAHADFALNNSVSESTKTASTFAREVTERSVSRIQKRAREERTRRTLERFEEKNEHGFDNRRGPGNVTGIYRWVDKYYRARVVNYGRRLMLEFIIPEPAAFYLAMTSNRPLAGVTLPRPQPPTVYGVPLQPGHLNSSNYDWYIAAYNVQDAAAFPEVSIRIGAAVKATSTKEDANSIIGEVSEKLVCPPGYEVDYIYGIAYRGGWSGYSAEIEVAGESLASVTASDLEGIIPISIVGYAGYVSVNVVVSCSLKEEAIRSWQLKTYGSIMTGYERALAAYNEQVAAARVQQGVAIEGRNPDLNRKLERDELRKAALRSLSNNYSTLVIDGGVQANFGLHAMNDNGDFGYPEFSPSRAHFEGKVIQFFEQAFEWNNMVYRFYPYFWGRKGKWRDEYSLTDVDPMFTDFLRAGAARVVVPVHPAYPAAVLHFMHTSEIWNGGEPPTINDPLYVSIIDELRSDAQVNDDGDDLEVCSIDSTTPCFIDEWEVKLPTTLVYLQQDSNLPVFTSSETMAPEAVSTTLDEMVIASGKNLDWRHSVVDLLVLLNRDADLGARKAMALAHGCPTESGSAAMNICLRAKIVEALAANGGTLPGDF